LCAGLCLASSVAALGGSATSALAASANVPNDQYFSLLWGDRNTGQAIPAQTPPLEELGAPIVGTPGADDRASEAWTVTTGSREVVVGVADTGVDYNHPDLAANIWSNPGGIGGCPAGTHGWNVIAGTCDPMDREITGYGGHGTHVAGIIGAAGNNGSGVAGMNWQTTILPVKWLESATEEVGTLIAGLKWLLEAKKAGVNIRVVNDSPNFKSEQPGLKKAIEELGANNILFVTAAGNSLKPYYPCAYDLPNEICVTATNNRDELPPWANHEPYGPGVDLAAPGVSIFSTMLREEYGYLSGGSMAAAQVSGAAALILSVAPGLTAEQLRTDILNNADPLASLQGKVEAGGRLDVCKAMPGCPPPPPTPPPAPAPPPPPPPAPPPQLSTVAITSRFLKVHHGMIRVGLRCSGPTACASKLALVVNVKVKVKKTSGRGTRTSIKKIALTIGAATFTAQPGGTVRVTIKPNAIGRKILATGSGRLYVNLTIFASVPAPPATQTQRVQLVWKPARSPAK
jgi:hypothetical protein